MRPILVAGFGKVKRRTWAGSHGHSGWYIRGGGAGLKGIKTAVAYWMGGSMESDFDECVELEQMFLEWSTWSFFQSVSSGFGLKSCVLITDIIM